MTSQKSSGTTCPLLGVKPYHTKLKLFGSIWNNFYYIKLKKKQAEEQFNIQNVL